MPRKLTATAMNNDAIPAAAEFVTDAVIRDREKANMIYALDHANWKIWGDGGAADLLGIKPSTLTYRMKDFGIRKDE
jgi:transcriptional regulator with GAF, ATPase, and Fis domain